jgi:hypothetical protein
MVVARQKGENAILELLFNLYPKNINSMCTSGKGKDPFFDENVHFIRKLK